MNRRKPVPYRQFSHLFNAYSKYYNKQNDRTGSLFEKSFHRLIIDSKIYFRNLIIYIHMNPVHHGFTDDFKNYPWSSYGSVISLKPTKLQREKVIGWFDDLGNFLELHIQGINNNLIKNLNLE